jgi:hypothetical protein
MKVPNNKSKPSTPKRKVRITTKSVSVVDADCFYDDNQGGEFTGNSTEELVNFITNILIYEKTTLLNYALENEFCVPDGDNDFEMDVELL